MPNAHHQPVFQTKCLQQAQAFTSRVWAKHESTVPEADDFSSDISRSPLGGSHFCTVDCASSIDVVIDGCSSRSFLYLPLEGSMEIRVDGETLAALPGGPVLIPPKLAYEFSATPIQCIVVELRTGRLRSELDAMGCAWSHIPPLAWSPDDPDAQALTSLLHFAHAELAKERRIPPSPSHLRHLEALVISCLARMVVGRLEVSNSVDCKIGRRTADEIADWLKRRVSQVIDLSELAKYAGLSIRSLERRFLQFFHRSPAAYLKELRLDATHAKLSQPACRMSVTEVALAFHFEHLGRFSTSYRQKFGEKPSATLNRTKQSQSDNPHIFRKATRK
jgi:AraC-like DNA-binding protein